MIGLITTYFNPCNSKKRWSNYVEFRKQLKQPIITVELAYDDCPFLIDDSIKIRGTKKNLLWQKERLLNIALESLPSQIDKVAWLDADIIFENEQWLSETEAALDRTAVIQPFENVVESASSEVQVYNGPAIALNLNQSECRRLAKIPGVRGLAWAARREVLENGFFDMGVLGSGDTYHLIAWLNDWNDPHVKQMPPLLRKQFLLWAWKTGEKVGGNIGTVQGKVIHLHHGSFKGRDWLGRQKILINHNFSPTEDLIKDHNDLWAFVGNKPKLEQEINNYFEVRKLDEN